MLSLSDDNTFKIREFGSEHAGLYSNYFYEKPLSCGLHPSGFQCGIGFKEEIKFYYILDGDIKIAF